MTTASASARPLSSADRCRCHRNGAIRRQFSTRISSLQPRSRPRRQQRADDFLIWWSKYTER
jgi:hypothetical protein